MKITTDTPDLLIVEQRSWLLGLGFGAGLLLLVGLTMTQAAAGAYAEALGLGLASLMLAVFFALFVRREQVVFYRTDGWIELRSRTMYGGTRRVRHGLDEVERAVLASSDGGETHRIELVIPVGQSTGQHPLTAIYTNANHTPTLERINAWLADARR